MLRNRSRTVTTKQALMSDHAYTNPSSPISSFLNSPRFFNGFLSKNLFSDNTETNAMSPKSILDTKNTSNRVNPFAHDNNVINPSPKQDTKAIGLALIDSIIADETIDEAELVSSNFCKPINRTSLCGSKLKVQIPIIKNPTSLTSPNDESPKSPADFGIKTKNFQTVTPVKDLARQLSLKEMELSEDYTCVITHGPNPKTTHIFDDCIVESCLGDDPLNSECKKMDLQG